MSHRLLLNLAVVLLFAVALVSLPSTWVYAESPKNSPEIKATPDVKPSGQAERKPAASNLPVGTVTATNLVPVVEAKVVLDPQAHLCTQVVQDLQRGGEPMRTILLWAHGYFSSTYNADEIGSLNAEVTTQLLIGLTDYCQKHPSLSLARAVDALSTAE